MYIYVKSLYEQWCCGQDDDEIISRFEVFIDMVHEKIGYPKDMLRAFLYEQPWFKKLL